MMQGISSMGGMPPPPPPPQGAKMTEEQGQDLTDFLADYDTDDLSEDDAKQIVSKIQELGITPNADLASVLSGSGIEMQALGELAGISPPEGGPPAGGPPPGGPPPSGGPRGSESVDETVVSMIAEAVEAYEDSDGSESLWSILEPALQEAGYDTSQPMIDFYS